MEDSEAKCDKCEGEVRPEAVGVATLDKLAEHLPRQALSKKVLIREAELAGNLVVLLEENVRNLQAERQELLGTLLGLGFVATYAVLKYTVFY